MNVQSKFAAIVISGVIGLGVASPVLAVSAKAKGRGAVDLQANVAATRAGSRPGLLREFFTKSRAAIGSGTITAINGTTLTVTTNEGKVVTVLTDDKTQFRRRFWGKGTLAELKANDVVNVIGLWQDDAKTTILARLVRDLSIERRTGVFIGIVQSLTSGGFVIKTEQRGNLTVTTSDTTKFVNRREEAITKADVKVDHRVRVKGLWDRNLNTITEVVQVKDFSLPAKPTPTATATATPTATP